MQEPDFTCPSIDDLLTDFEQIKDTQVLETELDILHKKTINEAKEQYEYYLDKLTDKLENIRTANSNIREWGKSMECKLEQIADTISKYKEAENKQSLIDIIESVDFIIS